MSTELERNHARDNAQCHLQNIVDLFAAIEHLNNYDTADCSRGAEEDVHRSDCAACSEVVVDGETFTETEALYERLREIPLSVMVRGEWYDYTEGPDEQPSEYELLLTTGGPALRIRGDLEDGIPTRAYMEYQDWGTPWTLYHVAGIGNTLLDFAQLFFG